MHPHQGFEILSFVLEGEIEHYDTKNKTWSKLEAGDVQIIRSGNGISHAEKLLPNSSIFQIWFDPDLNKTLSKPATYNDYPAASFPSVKQNGFTTKIFKGENAPIEMVTEGVTIKEVIVEKGAHHMPLLRDKVYSVFVIAGAASLDEIELNKEDFARIEQADSVTVVAKEQSKLFIIESPLKPSYTTYIEMNR